MTPPRARGPAKANVEARAATIAIQVETVIIVEMIEMGADTMGKITIDDTETNGGAIEGTATIYQRTRDESTTETEIMTRTIATGAGVDALGQLHPTMTIEDDDADVRDPLLPWTHQLRVVKIHGRHLHVAVVDVQGHLQLRINQPQVANQPQAQPMSIPRKL